MPRAATSAAEMYNTYADGIAEFAADDDVLLKMERKSSDSVTVNADGAPLSGSGPGGRGSARDCRSDRSPQ